MIKQAYKDQVALLLRVLPEVAKEGCFAMHGGTAINLFVRNMPRLSVDIDLTYVPIEDRETSLHKINAALERIKENVIKLIKDVKITDEQENNKAHKLYISLKGVPIKLEVNLIKRGTLTDPVKMELCARAQQEFNSYCEINVVSFGELYGGKICAAMDRQHPRDLFDVKLLLDAEGFNKEVKTGFIFFTAGSNKALHQMINPHLHDQHDAFENSFEGMSDEPFTYEEFETIRQKLIQVIRQTLTKQDREFLLNLKGLTPDWSHYNFEKFPAVQWKLLNLQHLKETKPEKHQELYEILKNELQL